MGQASTVEDSHTLNQLLSDGLPECSVSDDGDLTISNAEQNLVWCSFGIRPPQFNMGMLYVTDTQNTRLQGLGIGKKLLQNIKKAAQNQQLTSIVTLASELGAYVWARAGFVTEDWDTLRGDILDRMLEIPMPNPERESLENLLLHSTNPKDLWVIADSKYGKALLQGQGYKAHVDLDDQEMMQRFDQYTALSKFQQRAIRDGLNEALER